MTVKRGFALCVAWRFHGCAVAMADSLSIADRSERFPGGGTPSIVTQVQRAEFSLAPRYENQGKEDARDRANRKRHSSRYSSRAATGCSDMAGENGGAMV